MSQDNEHPLLVREQEVFQDTDTENALVYRHYVGITIRKGYAEERFHSAHEAYIYSISSPFGRSEEEYPDRDSFSDYKMELLVVTKAELLNEGGPNLTKVVKKAQVKTEYVFDDSTEYTNIVSTLAPHIKTMAEQNKGQFMKTIRKEMEDIKFAEQLKVSISTLKEMDFKQLSLIADKVTELKERDNE